MRRFMLKIVAFIILLFATGFLDEFLRDINIDFTHLIYFTIGWIGCSMFLNT